MSMSARIILDSVGPNEVRLTTFELILPRIVLAEFNTHRMLSRNSASSRAIPVEKMLERTRTDPFIPDYWGKNQKGMQAEEELSRTQQDEARQIWQFAARNARNSAQALKDIGVHKQITNRLLEPFLWHTIIFTATELDNFIALRANKMAAPEIRKPAEMLVDVYHASKPMQLQAGEWHLPLVTRYDLMKSDGDNIVDFKKNPGGYFVPGVWVIQNTQAQTTWEEIEMDWLYWAKISAARCARTSYLTHEGKRDLSEDEGMYLKLTTSGHMSPLEHLAKALTRAEWERLAHLQATEWMESRIPVGNFYGWDQLRKQIKNEHNFGLLQ